MMFGGLFVDKFEHGRFVHNLFVPGSVCQSVKVLINAQALL